MRLKKQLTPQQALERAREMCNRAEHCSGEILRKLADWGLTSSQAGEIITALKSSRLVDDARFARAYARDKMEYLGWGRRKIAMSLAVKKVDRGAIGEALDALDENIYRCRLMEIMRRKKKSLGEDSDTYDGRTKVFRHAVSRGFEPALVIEFMKHLADQS